MAERREGWVRWDDFLFFIRHGDIHSAYWLTLNGTLYPAQMIQMRGSNRCCVANLRDGYWAVKVGNMIYDTASKTMIPVKEA